MNLPLAGKRVLVTRPEHQAESLAEPLRALGAEPITLPTVAILPPEDWLPVDEAIFRLHEFDWAIFTSVNGVQCFVSRMQELGIPLSVLAERRLAAIGPATASELERVCRKPDVVPNEFISDAIPDVLGEVYGMRILLPRADIARKALAHELRKRGAQLEEVTVYRVQQDIKPTKLSDIAKQKPDFITLTSPSTARSLAKALHEAGLSEWMKTVPIICIGPITANAVRELGYQPARVASEHTINGLVKALLEEAMHHAYSEANT